MIRTSFIVLAVSLFTPLLLAAQEMRVISSDHSGCTIEYRPAVTSRIFTEGGVAYTLFEFSESIPHTPGLAGAPDLHYRSELLVLPAYVGNVITVMQADYTDYREILVAPIPSKRISEQGTETLYLMGASYQKTGFIPEAIAELVNIGVARNQLLGNVHLTPVQWDPIRRIARMYSRILVRIDFGPPISNLRHRGKSDRLFNVAALNHDMGERWVYEAPAPLKKAASTNLAEGVWYRIEIVEEGIYKLDKSWFQNAGIDVANIDPRTIKMFGSGGKELSADITTKRPENLNEIAIEVIGESDGRFDENDYVLFYGQGLAGFMYDAGKKRYSHYIHRFDKVNAYLLTYGGTSGKRIKEIVSLNDPDPFKPQWFIGKEFVEEESVNLLNSGKLWLSKKINPAMQANSIMYSKKLQGIVSSQPVLYRVMLYSQSDNGTTNSFTLSDAGKVLGSVQMGTVNFNADDSDVAATSGVREFSRTGDFPDDRSSLTISYTASDPEKNRGGYIDWMEWYYSRQFLVFGDALGFSAPDTTAVISYEINGFSSSDIRVYDVSEFDNLRKISDPMISGGTVRFQAATVTGTPSQYLTVASNVIKTPPAPVRVKNSNLHVSEGAEFLIITAEDFVPAVDKLKAHRERSGEERISSMVVSIPEIYNEFNSGVSDPTAIRNFIAYTLKYWQSKPRYVLLFGDGHFDYKNYTTKERIIVPVWETENSIHLMDSYVTDDYFGQVIGPDSIHTDSRVDICIGRFPVQTFNEAVDIVNKIIAYETQSAFDPWRNRITFVADDGLTTRGDDGNTHTSQSEEMANSLPVENELKKVYIVSYRTENTAQGRRKPDANKAIIDQINEGTLIINYTGHGSEAVWAHEQIFVSDVTVPQLKNAERQTFFCAATCAFGLYDKPDMRSGTELLIMKPEGGAIGGLSAPRVVYAGENSAFNRAFLIAAINNGRENDGRVRRIGEANFAAKQQCYGKGGYEKFHLFCDPTVRLSLPRNKVVLDSMLVNDRIAWNDTIQFKALSKITVHASVRKPDNTLWNEFQGSSLVSLYDAERNVLAPEWPNWKGYKQQGGLLYRGLATITDGRFSVSFIIPKDISYENNKGRLAIYFDNKNVDGAGFANNFRIGGTDTSSVADAKGPDISLFMDRRDFQPGDMVNENSLLIAELYDENGINTTGLGIGHSIEAWLDNSPNGIVLNSYYKSRPDSYQHGTVEYQFQNLAAGTHTIRLRSWDIYNNSSQAETHFVVANSAHLTMYNVYPYPNPIQDRTFFTFHHNQSSSVKVEIKIYTLNGRLVKKIEEQNIFDRFVRILWDGKDEDGSALANGVYYYKIICASDDGSRGSEALGKLTILR